MQKPLAALARRAVGCFARYRAFVLALVASVSAALVFGGPADIARGLVWLQAQVQSDGTLRNQGSAGAQQQAQCQTAATLIKLSAGNPAVSTLIAAIGKSADQAATETIGCWQQLNVQLAQATGNQLDTRRVSQQGYAAYAQHQAPNALDTGWALAAALASLPADDKATLLAWLQSTQSTSGAFLAVGKQDIFATAVILRGLRDQVASNTIAASVAQKAAAWLFSQRDSQGVWLADVAVTSVVYEAVHPYSGPQTSLASMVEAFLLGQQQSDGSWQADAYTTAVALRALALTAVAPVDPTTHGAVVQGAVRDGLSGQPIANAVVTVTPSSGPSQNASTDGAGRYYIQGIAAGAGTLSATSSGYQVATASATFRDATSADFSPSLYPVGSTPPAGGRITGSVIVFGTSTPLAGASVTAGAVSTTTDTAGSYGLAIARGDLQLSFALAGYMTAVQQVIVADGANIQLPQVALRPALQSSTVRGTVRNYAGNPIVGATVQAGTATATTDGTGSYALAGLAGSSIGLQASAAGYVAQSVMLTPAVASNLVQDFVLPDSSASYLTLSGLAISPASAGLRSDVTATITVSNPSSGTATASVSMLVIDPNGKVIARAHAIDASGVVISDATLAAGQSSVLRFPWNTASFGTGSYKLVPRLFVPSSASYQSPDGLTIASLNGQLTIEATPHFSGSISASPPLQAAPNLPVALSALVQNDGNVALYGQAFTVSVVDTTSSKTVYTQAVNSSDLSVSQLQSLSFGNWTPTAAGNYQLRLTAASTPGSLVTSTVFIGPSTQASFTVDRNVVPAGTQTVRGSVTIAGQSATTTVSDPLTPVIKQALTKAVGYADPYSYADSLKKGCYACHMQAQAVVGGERSLRYTPAVDALRRAVVMQAITQKTHNDYDPFVTSTGPISQGAKIIGETPSTPSPIASTTLAFWATNNWHDPSAVNYTKGRFAKYLMDQQLADGSWPVDYTGGWWDKKAPLAALNLGGLLNLRDVATTAPTSLALKKFVPMGVQGLPGGTYKTAVDATGTVYIAMGYNGTWSVSPSGQVTQLVSGNTQHAWGVAVLSGNRIAIGTDDGVYIRQPDGTLTRLASIPSGGNSIRVFANGDLLVAPAWWYWIGNLYRVRPDGTVSVFAQHNGIVGLSDLEITPDGSVLVLNDANKTVMKFNPTGQVMDSPVPRTAYGSLHSISRYNDGYLISGQGGLWFFNKDWVPQMWREEWTYGATQLPDGRLLSQTGDGLSIMQDNPVDAQALLSQIATTFGRSATWLQQEAGFNADSNIEVAFRLMALGYAKQYFAGTSRASEFDSLMGTLATTLRARQRPDGGWFLRESDGVVSDSMVTAMVGVALDTMNPSPSAPEVQKAILFLLGSQQRDGTWISESGLASTPLMATTWVEIWMPTMLDRLATLGTTLNITVPANVALSNPSQQPSSSSALPDGSSSYRWDVSLSSQDVQVGFDLTLKDMQVDELRAVAANASLQFANSYTGGTVTAAIDVPKVAVSTNVSVAVATDKPSYIDSDQAVFTATITNNGTAARDVQAKFTVLDGANRVVETLPLPAVTNVAPGASGQSAVPWPAAGVLAGNYQLRADLSSPSGYPYGTATTSFSITAAQTQTSLARVTTDRSSYTAAQTVQITTRLTNATSNTSLDAVTASLDIVGSGGSVFNRSEAIDQIAPANARQYAYSLPAAGLPAGNYLATLQLLDSSGVALARSTASFNVLGADATGVGLTGKLQAAPATVFVGQATQLSLQASNTSGTSLTGVPVNVRIIDPVSGTVVATLSDSIASWPAGQTAALTFAWQPSANAGQTLVAVASAQLAGKDVRLAQVNLQVLGILYTGSMSVAPTEVEAGSTASLNYVVTNPAPVTGHMAGGLAVQTQDGQTLASWPLDLTVAAQSSYAGNQIYVSGDQQQTLRAVLSQQVGTSTVTLGTSTFKIVDPPVPVGITTGLKGKARFLVLVSCPPGLGTQEDAACVAQRSQALTTYLSALGYTVKTVSTGDAFLAEMRCGTYNTYWISNGAIKLTAQTIGELRESVRRGEALWTDGMHDSMNQLLNHVAGIKYVGKLAATNEVAELSASGIYGAQNLATMGKPDAVELTTGAAQGTFVRSSSQQTPVPAVVSNEFGSGRSVLFAFDLAAMLTADVVQANTQLTAFTGVSAGYTAAGSPTLTIGDVTQLAASVTNQGTRTVSFKAQASLPIGLTSMATTPPAQLVTNNDGTVQATWTFTLAGGASQDLAWLVRATQSGSLSAPLSVYSLPAAGSTAAPKLRASASLLADVKDGAVLLQQPAPSIGALQPTASSDKSNQTKALDAVNAALALHAQGNYELAIAQWLAAADAVAAITSVDTAQAKKAIALALEATTDALCLQRCGSTSCQ